MTWFKIQTIVCLLQETGKELDKLIKKAEATIQAFFPKNGYDSWVWAYTERPVAFAVAGDKKHVK